MIIVPRQLSSESSLWTGTFGRFTEPFAVHRSLLLFAASVCPIGAIRDTISLPAERFESVPRTTSSVR